MNISPSGLVNTIVVACKVSLQTKESLCRHREEHNFERERWPSERISSIQYPFPYPNELSELQRCSAVRAFQRRISHYILKTLECQDIRQWCRCWQEYCKIIFLLNVSRLFYTVVKNHVILRNMRLTLLFQCMAVCLVSHHCRRFF